MNYWINYGDTKTYDFKTSLNETKYVTWIDSRKRTWQEGDIVFVYVNEKTFIGIKYVFEIVNIKYPISNSFVDFNSKKAKHWLDKKKLMIKLSKAKTITITRLIKSFNISTISKIDLQVSHLKQFYSTLLEKENSEKIINKYNLQPKITYSNFNNISQPISEHLRKKTLRKYVNKTFIERDQSFVKKAKSLYFDYVISVKERKDLPCQICSFSLKEKYLLSDNELDKYIEIHHKNKVSNVKNKKYKLYNNLKEIFDDFIFCCPNCHKVLDKYNKAIYKWNNRN